MPKKFMHDLEIKKIGLVRKAANKRKFLIFKSEDSEEEDSNTMPRLIDLLKEKLNAVFEDEDLVKAASADDAEGGDADLKTPVKKETKEVATPSIEEIVKDNKLPTEVVAVIKGMQTAQAEQATQIQNLTETIQKDAAARETEEIQKTADSFKALPVEAEALTKALTALRKSDSESYAPVVEMLEKVDKIVQNGTLFDTVGSGLTPVQKSEGEKLTKAVEDIRKADPKLTEVEAMEKAYTDNPELYEAQYSAMPNVGDPDETS